MTDLSHISIFEGLPEAELSALQELCITRTYPKNTVIINEGDQANAMFICTSGKVKVYVSDENGKEFVLNSMGPGEYFGELSLLDDETRSASVITTDKSTFSILYKDDFSKVVLNHPDIALVLLRNLASRIRKLTENVKTLALQDVYGRIRKTLLDLSTEKDGDTVIEEKLTQQDIANRIGSSREMVARILKDLATGGYIEIERKQFRILKKLPESY
ncbi:MAG: Crp/Fnr family transcriptional regulator [Pseudomonadales bacterium]|jgi:CRP/FNR family transcriptional regulator, cyclic AMP receptor protein|uniref:Crp/Fnr family transcriptional regulator n=1 Tax=unclassified Ketobacter TaxID=2639109 RepID=UPI000C3C0BB1|nr:MULTISPECIES: Crp/Fnr family transcriptional regulator [unclassified Ketobacter]MAA59208.1 Crp/Fnr family transcriptional regulator [Pseudomonadales bacterium]MEC8811373.1 Crp/Fnr family transcriptional regulator [Pseudomonadota bacterium]TNC88336.1 MAG: Crp/Fnr family transcriptional regulator [Alcanivorax sp.]HBO94356.1 Crp/Fnr family transcriptional regulator [Gammaproteobacteria bacterium]MAQ23919.1 Crp/Fnr family transcriptional regulator [Pseudomonadales bacterium]|tara:strand:+ start:4190 stop:4840 length:651 start_codon:yes stop_codon:yes gene_type:complete